MYRFLLALVLFLLPCAPAQAVPIIGRSVLAQGGGEATSGNLMLQSTVGEDIIGYGQTEFLNCWLGFWTPQMDRSAVQEPNQELPRYFLSVNGTTISYGVGSSHAAMIHIDIYDVSGRLIRGLIDGVQSPGVYSINWNSTSSTGARVASGLYFVSFRADDIVQTRKFVVFN